MKLPCFSLRRGLLLTALTLITTLTASAAEAFEGRVHMDLTSGRKKEKTGIDYAMKEGKLRIDPQMPEGRGGGVGMIMDLQAREMIVLMDMGGRKMFMRRPIAMPAAESSSREGDGHPVSPPQPTGRTEVIAGITATEYRLTSEKGETVELWLAKGLGPFMSFSGGNPMMGGRGDPPPGWEGFVRDGNSFPMRVVTHGKDGAESMRMEVTSVDKTPLPASLFSTDGYTEFSMPGFGGGGMNPFKRD